MIGEECGVRYAQMTADMLNPSLPGSIRKNQISRILKSCRDHDVTIFTNYPKWAVRRFGIPEDRVRFHICWGSWHGPHRGDVELKDVVDLLLKVKAQGYSVEAGNVRHEHEWKVWQSTKLPDGKVVTPGVVSHATNVLEHPELVADRILRFARTVGRENVIASTDCGLGGRVHPQIAWAKLAALSEGARLATKALWK